MPSPHESWLTAAEQTIASHRRMIDAVIAQLTDEELHRRPAPELNSVAILLRHLGGNLQSRWTDFLTTDGEKPTRDRDTEFDEWPGDRQSLISYFDDGWNHLNAALETLAHVDPDQLIAIRGEQQTVASALWRSVTHIAYHTGQIAMIARTVHTGDWNWLTIAPGKSDQHNQQTWGTAASRSVQGKQ